VNRPQVALAAAAATSTRAAASAHTQPELCHELREDFRAQIVVVHAWMGS
jgi:hypothetical protein